MKNWIIMGGLLTLAGMSLAQERISDEDAQKYGRKGVELAAKEANLPIKIDANPDKSSGLKLDEVGVLIIPDKNVTEAALKNAGKDIVPLGQLWFRKLTFVLKDQPLPGDKLRKITFNSDGQDHEVVLSLLGVRKKNGTDLELVVYGPGKEPLAVYAVKNADIRQDLPIEMEAMPGDNDRGVLTLNIAGKYQVQMTLAKQD
jgi:hypothetical protein